MLSTDKQTDKLTKATKNITADWAEQSSYALQGLFPSRTKKLKYIIYRTPSIHDQQRQLNL